MSRSTVYNRITNEENKKKINPNNKQLIADFLEYLGSVDRSPKTIHVYGNDLEIFFIWNLEHNHNKDFVEITKRELIRFQNYAINEWKWSPKRTRRVKSTLSSLSTFIENILDEEFKDFKSIVKKIDSPVNETIREKTILSDEQVEFLLNTLVERGEYEKSCAVAIAAYSGMRKSELLQMKMDYFTPKRIQYGCLYATDKIRTKGRGRLGKQIQKYIMVKVDKYIKLWKKQREELGIDSEWVFASKKSDGTCQQRSSIDSWAIYFSEILGVDFYFHSLRHYTCTMMVRSNLPTEVIREFFLWNDSSMVQLYSDIDISESFGQYFSTEGVIKQETKKISDL